MNESTHDLDDAQLIINHLLAQEFVGVARCSLAGEILQQNTCFQAQSPDVDLSATVEAWQSQCGDKPPLFWPSPAKPIPIMVVCDPTLDPDAIYVVLEPSSPDVPLPLRSKPSTQAALMAISQASIDLLNTDSVEDAIPGILQLITESLGCHRAGVYVIEGEEDDLQEAVLRHSWCVSDMQSRQAICVATSLSPHRVSVSSEMVAKVSAASKAIFNDLSSSTGYIRWFMLCCHTYSCMRVPVFLEKAFWGFVILEDCQRERLWSDAEIKVLMLTANLLAAALGKQQTSEALAISRESLYRAQKLDSLGKFAGGIAHEFNNVLTAVIGHARLAREDIGDTHPIAFDLDAIIQAGERATQLSNRLLVFTRRNKVVIANCNLTTVLENVHSLLRGVLTQNIELVTVLEEGSVYLALEAGQLEQILINLAINARDAMEPSGKITIRSARTRLTPEQRLQYPHLAPTVYARLAFTDTGTGIPKDVQEKMFDPFFSTKDPGKGTGLGLSIVYELVTLQSGFLEVRSEPNQGTTFYIYLPVVDKPIDKAPSGREEEVAYPGTETVLIVDDEAMLRNLLGNMLSPLGYKVITAPSGAEAVELLERHPEIDIVLADIVMPVQSGPEMVAAMRKIRQDFKVLYMSGHAERSAMDIDKKPLRSNLLTKPFTKEVLSKKIRNVLDA